MQTPLKTFAVSTALMLSTALAGCGSEETPEAAPGTPSSSTSTALPECTADDVVVTAGAARSDEPTITIPDTCAPPSTLVSKDLIAGSGPAAQQGANLSVNYTLVTWSDKAKLDSSYGRGPFDLENLGSAAVIDGWNQGLIGIKAGARRLLVVPPELGYGAGGNGIAPNETLVFVIDATTIG